MILDQADGHAGWDVGSLDGGEGPLRVGRGEGTQADVGGLRRALCQLRVLPGVAPPQPGASGISLGSGRQRPAGSRLLPSGAGGLPLS